MIFKETDICGLPNLDEKLAVLTVSDLGKTHTHIVRLCLFYISGSFFFL